MEVTKNTVRFLVIFLLLVLVVVVASAALQPSGVGGRGELKLGGDGGGWWPFGSSAAKPEPVAEESAGPVCPQTGPNEKEVLEYLGKVCYDASKDNNDYIDRMIQYTRASDVFPTGYKNLYIKNLEEKKKGTGRSGSMKYNQVVQIDKSVKTRLPPFTKISTADETVDIDLSASPDVTLHTTFKNEEYTTRLYLIDLNNLQRYTQDPAVAKILNMLDCPTHKPELKELTMQSEGDACPKYAYDIGKVPGRYTVIGYGTRSNGSIDEDSMFKTPVLSKPSGIKGHITILRGDPSKLQRYTVKITQDGKSVYESGEHKWS